MCQDRIISTQQLLDKGGRGGVESVCKNRGESENNELVRHFVDINTPSWFV